MCKELKKIGDARISLLLAENTSLYNVISSVYPEYEWLPWRFEKVPKHYWDSLENQRKFIEWAGKELQIKEMSDWYNVSNKVYKYLCFS